MFTKLSIAALSLHTVMPITLFTKKDQLASKFKGWCIFFDSETHTLRSRTTDFDDPFSEQDKERLFSDKGTAASLHMGLLPKDRALKNNRSSTASEIAHRIAAKEKDGFAQLGGNWYVAPDNGAIADFTQLSQDDKARVIVRDCSVNGVISATNPRHDSRRKSLPEDMMDRLAAANPVADTWFFST